MLAAKSPEYRLWPSGQQGLPELRVSIDVARELAGRVLEGVNALPRRGLEISGLLIGKVDPRCVYVDALVPIDSDYASGPMFIATEENVQYAMEKADTVGPIVGLYRSRTDSGVDLDDQSGYMLRAVPTGNVVAFIGIQQTRSTRPQARAGMQTAAGFEWLSEPLELQAWMRGGAGTESAPVPVAPVREASEKAAVIPLHVPVAVPARAPAPITASTQQPGRSRRWIAMAACFAAGGVLTFLLTRGGGEPEQAGTAAVTPRAVSAPAPKVEGAREQDPVPQEVRNRTTPVERPPAAPRVRKAESRKKDSRKTGQRRPEPRKAVPPPRQARQSPPSAQSTASAQSTESAQPPQSAQSGPASPSRVADPGARKIELGPAQEVARVLPSASGTTPPFSADAGTAAQTSAAPSASSPPTRSSPVPATSVPAPAGPSVQFVPPRLARQPRPVVVPPDLRRMLNHEMVISAKVSVDAQGRVKRVVPLNSLSRIERSIWQSYASVITTWEFDSAVQNGKPVPGETILRFRVQPAR